MKRKKLTRMLSAFLAATMVFTMSDFSVGKTVDAKAATVSGSETANFDFENDLEGWDTFGTVTVVSDNVQSGSKSVKLEAGASMTMLLTDIKQGSYTLSAWLKGTAGKNANITVSQTGGPDSVALLDTYMKSDTWTQMGHRNVLVYNGQMQITITAGTTALELDNLELALDSADANTIANWDFEDGLNHWEQTGTVAEDTENVDTGAKAIKLSAGSEIAQTVAVEPNTRYSVTMRAKVDNQDTFETTKVTSSYRKDSAGNPAVMGEMVERTSLGNRVNIGVRTTDGTVLRQAPSGTEGYSLITLTFTTGAEDEEVEIYANTIYDENYKDSVTIYKTEGTELADNWTGNGEDYAYVDNFDIFRIQDENYLRGADVSFLSAIEDLDGKYFANGVQQDCLRILSNHGVNSITNMIFVKAGEPAHYPDSLKTVYIDEYWASGAWMKEDGSQAELKMIQGGYFDKEHSLQLGKRATELGMSYLPSFHYSDTWMSNAKAFTPIEWLDTDYEGNYSNTDLAHMQSIVYNYVYDFIKALADNDVNVCGVKHGNEQNGGIVWPVGSGSTSEGHAKLIAASYEAAEDAMPGISGYIHSNNGYTPAQFNSDGFFGKILASGAKMDGAALSLYGGRSSGNTILMTNAMLNNETMRYMDYVNVETAYSFTRYYPTIDSQTGAMGQSQYYYTSGNGQYNWLLDYMQAALDTPNPYGQTRGFYYWEVDWIPTPGAGSTDGGSADVTARIMFNNGDTSIKEMGSNQAGKAGDMMDSMYAYLMRGCAKDKADTMQTPLRDAGTYSVEVTEPTGISLSKESITIAEGKKERLQPTITPVDKILSDSDIVYTSADASVAKVTQDGFVCGVNAGTTTVTASVKGGYTATVNVTVTKAEKAENITLTVDGAEIENHAEKTVTLFDKVQLSAKLPDSATNKAVVYTSSNPEVASFLGETWQTPDGEMRQETEKNTKVQLNVKGTGTTTITAASADGNAAVSFTLNSNKVAAESVTISDSKITLSYGRSKQLSATVAPENTTRYLINWVSEKASVAKVDETGFVTATGVGTTTIKAVSDDNAEVYAECEVEVLPVQVEGIELSKSSLAIQVGSTKTINALISPADADNKNISWTSADENIVSVNEKGEVTGVAIGGPVTITATTENGGFTATCEVTVQKDAIPVTGMTVDTEEYYFASDYFSEENPAEDAPVYRLNAVVEPETATNTEVVWTSDAPDVATVDALGRVTAVSSGVATITATTEEGGFKAQTKIYVPSISESFDNLEVGNTWGTKVSSLGGGALGGTVAADETGNIFQISGGGSGKRSI
ncbi:MAG: Ig-like domain-containing protein [Lachnospiraceae bacterium]|nr:Ig-like domain-containing protein [Lachnospiraceae bacterium]